MLSSSPTAFSLSILQDLVVRIQGLNILRESHHDRRDPGQQEVINGQSSLSLYARTCPDPPKGYLVTSSNLTRPWLQLPYITAIIFFNHDHYDAIPFLELLYGGVFPSRVYCGPVPLKNKNLTAAYKINFVTYDNAGLKAGELFYVCVANVMLQFPRSSGGYLIFPDDMLFLPHRLPHLNENRIWYWPYDKLRRVDINTMLECTDAKCERSSRWAWNYYNAESLRDFWTDLAASRQARSDVQRYYGNLVGHLGGEGRMAAGWADVFYVPARFAKDYIAVSAFAASNHVTLGAAVATILVAISDDTSNWEVVAGWTDWSNERNKPWIQYRGARMVSLMAADYHHPTKWGLMLRGNENMRKFYCYIALPVVYSRHGRV